MVSIAILIISVLTLLRPPPPAAANVHSTSALLRSQSIIDEPAAALSVADIPPTTFFEVTNPIPLPNTKPCSYLLLQHDFAFTYGHPPVLADYTPPSDCPSQTFSKIVLEWSATCKGRQFDRIFGVWLGGVEILRSCTAEPRATGIVWTVKKDVTRYSSLMMTNQTLAVYLGNIVDNTYTGVYHVNLSLHFYPPELGHKLGFESRADLILPISRNLPLNDGLWFEIENSTDFGLKEFKIPQNAYRAVLEVYVSFHENDESWYGNVPNEYITANNLTGMLGNGPFREVVVILDGLVVGAVWPFTVIYTGGVNPLFWRPISGIGSFDLPSYDIDITPFLGKILDGKSHRLAFGVTNALNVWYIDANLHLWLDKTMKRTRGALLEYGDSRLSLSVFSNFTGLDGIFVTNASRSIVSSGWVKSSLGVVVTNTFQGFEYTNTMVMGNEANLQIVNQVINSNASVDTKIPSTSVVSSKQFTLSLNLNNIDRGHGTYDSVANVTLGIDDDKYYGASSTSKVKNLQKAEGYMRVKGNLVVAGLGSTKQEYDYVGDQSCYYRNISSSNYTILHDEEKSKCRNSKVQRSRPRRAFLGPAIGGRKSV